MDLSIKDLKLENFPAKAYEKIRYADMDRQGHVNNALFSTFFETGRVEILRDKTLENLRGQSEFVIANINLNFIGEIHYPGKIDIGTAILEIGRSSIKLIQCIYQNDELKASAESVIVQVSPKTRKSMPLSEDYKKAISAYQLK